MQSYKNRFNGKTQEIFEYARNFGVLGALDFYAPKGDYLCFQKFLVEASGDENIGVNPKVNGSSVEGLADHIVAALFRKYTQQQKIIEDLQKQVEIERLDRAKRQNELKLQGVKLLEVIK